MLRGIWGDPEPTAHIAGMKRLALWLAEGKIKPLISARYSLAGAVDALNAIAARQVTGKIVIVPTMN